jgi:hypothetical protein
MLPWVQRKTSRSQATQRTLAGSLVAATNGAVHLRMSLKMGRDRHRLEVVIAIPVSHVVGVVIVGAALGALVEIALDLIDLALGQLI